MADGGSNGLGSLDEEIRLLGAIVRDDPLFAFLPGVLADAAALDPGSMSFQLLVQELKAAKVPLGDWRDAVRARRHEEPLPAPTPEVEPEPAQDADERPTIKVVPDQLPQNVDELRDALVRDDPNLYQRGGTLVTIAKEPERREPFQRALRVGRSIVLRPGTPRIIELKHGALVLRAARAAAWQRFDHRTKEWMGSLPCKNVIVSFRDSEDAWMSVPPLRGIAETPFLSPSHRIVSKPGYDEETAYFLNPSCDPGPIGPWDSVEEARTASSNALRYMWTEMACDIPFRGLGEPDPASDPDRLVQWLRAVEVPDAFIGVSAVLTLLARPAIIDHGNTLGAVPGLIFEAAGQGSGKSLQMHTVALVATGRAASFMTFPMREGRPDEQELEKVLGACALGDAAIIAFDNIRGQLGGPAIEQRLTTKGSDAFRVLGVSERKVLPWHALIMFSVNNASMNDDMANRVLISRVESAREDPRTRPASSFRHPELLDALARIRPRLVRAALVILKAYLFAREAGATGEVEGSTMGSFEPWSRLIPTAIRWAGGPDILRARPEAGAGSDEETESHATLLRCWPQGWQGQRAVFVLGEAFRLERDIAHGKAPDDGQADVRGAIRSLTRTPEGRVPGPQAFGLALRRLLGRPRNGMRLARSIDTHSKVATWRVDKVG